MSQGAYLILLLAGSIVFIIFMTAHVRMNAFLVLLLAAFGTGLLSGMAPSEVISTVTGGFGSILSYIGIVIIAGTIIGTILEKSNATLSMADAVLAVVGKARSALAMSITGAVVSVSVFCDSGFVILSSLNRTLAKKSGTSMSTMAVALSSGLYATHTFIPPTPGPIAAAGTLGSDLGLVIIFGIIFAIPAVTAGYLWAIFSGARNYVEPVIDTAPPGETVKLPSAKSSFAPILIPIILITLKSVADFPARPFGEGGLRTFLGFFGDPTVALILGVFLAFRLIPRWSGEYLDGWVGKGLTNAASIVMITGAGGAFGAVLRATGIGDHLSTALSGYNLGIFLPFFLAATLKTAQGSTTVAIITSSALVAPMLGELGIAGETAKALTVISIGAGAMIMSHANDSYFWVVSQFSGMTPATAYKTHSMGTLVQGIVSIICIWAASFVLI